MSYLFQGRSKRQGQSSPITNSQDVFQNLPAFSWKKEKHLQKYIEQESNSNININSNIDFLEHRISKSRKALCQLNLRGNELKESSQEQSQLRIEQQGGEVENDTRRQTQFLLLESPRNELKIVSARIKTPFYSHISLDSVDGRSHRKYYSSLAQEDIPNEEELAQGQRQQMGFILNGKQLALHSVESSQKMNAHQNNNHQSSSNRFDCAISKSNISNFERCSEQQPQLTKQLVIKPQDSKSSLGRKQEIFRENDNMEDNNSNTIDCLKSAGQQRNSIKSDQKKIKSEKKFKKNPKQTIVHLILDFSNRLKGSGGMSRRNENKKGVEGVQDQENGQRKEEERKGKQQQGQSLGSGLPDKRKNKNRISEISLKPAERQIQQAVVSPGVITQSRKRQLISLPKIDLDDNNYINHLNTLRTKNHEHFQNEKYQPPHYLPGLKKQDHSFIDSTTNTTTTNIHSTQNGSSSTLSSNLPIQQSHAYYEDSRLMEQLLKQQQPQTDKNMTKKNGMQIKVFKSDQATVQFPTGLKYPEDVSRSWSSIEGQAIFPGNFENNYQQDASKQSHVLKLKTNKTQHNIKPKQKQLLVIEFAGESYPRDQLNGRSNKGIGLHSQCLCQSPNAQEQQQLKLAEQIKNNNDFEDKIIYQQEEEELHNGQQLRQERLSSHLQGKDPSSKGTRHSRNSTASLSVERTILPCFSRNSMNIPRSRNQGQQNNNQKQQQNQQKMERQMMAVAGAAGDSRVVVFSQMKKKQKKDKNSNNNILIEEHDQNTKEDERFEGYGETEEEAEHNLSGTFTGFNIQQYMNNNKDNNCNSNNADMITQQLQDKEDISQQHY